MGVEYLVADDIAIRIQELECQADIAISRWTWERIPIGIEETENTWMQILEIRRVRNESTIVDVGIAFKMIPVVASG